MRVACGSAVCFLRLSDRKFRLFDSGAHVQGHIACYIGPGTMAITSATATGGGVGLETFEDLRRRYGPSQTAFARRCRLTQPQVSEIERGVSTPRPETVERIAMACGIDPGSVWSLLEETHRRRVNPVEAVTHDLDIQIQDLYPRAVEGERADLAARLIALGESILTLVRDGAEVYWFRLGQRAYELRRDIEEANWHDSIDLAASRAAFRIVSEVCREADATYPEELEASDWQRHAEVLVEAARELNVGQIDVELDQVARKVVRVALRDSEGFLSGFRSYQLAADDLLDELSRENRLSPLAAQLFSVTAFLAGVREGVRRQASRVTQASRITVGISVPSEAASSRSARGRDF